MNLRTRYYPNLGHRSHQNLSDTLVSPDGCRPTSFALGRLEHEVEFRRAERRLNPEAFCGLIARVVIDELAEQGLFDRE
ncbi:MAG: hypothetical protein A3H95_09830 [Acidobacteria bacterium RIFCSPLOWO2_02_FULL_64_15]|nr:MAG: hypothetical protein A3H95_09830 [Acidobacteria bacterium RIFCSPLOWO2_02_FULL_64_15]